MASESDVRDYECDVGLRLLRSPSIKDNILSAIASFGFPSASSFALTALASSSTRRGEKYGFFVILG
jgi:hypothetical protein